MRPADTPPAAPDAGDDKPSKTRQKQAMHELQTLGEALAGLSDARLDALDMPETLREALREFQRTRSHEGRRRQRQYIGKLMRQAETGPLREAVAAAKLGQAHDALALHEAERWRDELLAHDQHLTRWMQAHPASDLQQLRSLIRAARKDAQPAAAPGVAQRQGRAYRDLFRHIRSHLQGSGTGHRDPGDDVDGDRSEGPGADDGDGR